MPLGFLDKALNNTLFPQQSFPERDLARAAKDNVADSVFLSKTQDRVCDVLSLVSEDHSPQLFCKGQSA